MNQAGRTGKYVGLAQMVGGLCGEEHGGSAHALRLPVNWEKLTKFFLRLKFFQNCAVGGKECDRDAGAHAEGIQIFMKTLVVDGLQKDPSYSGRIGSRPGGPEELMCCKGIGKIKTANL